MVKRERERGGFVEINSRIRLKHKIILSQRIVYHYISYVMYVYITSHTRWTMLSVNKLNSIHYNICLCICFPRKRQPRLKVLSGDLGCALKHNLEHRLSNFFNIEYMNDLIWGLPEGYRLPSYLVLSILQWILTM